MLGVWTAIKTASEVVEEVGWKRVIQRELGVSERVSVWCFWEFPPFFIFFSGVIELLVFFLLIGFFFWNFLFWELLDFLSR